MLQSVVFTSVALGIALGAAAFHFGGAPLLAAGLAALWVLAPAALWLGFKAEEAPAVAPARVNGK